jgi:hypothetical protein
VKVEKWGVWVLTGPNARQWCTHEDGVRIETDVRTARTIASLFKQAFLGCQYKVKRVPPGKVGGKTWHACPVCGMQHERPLVNPRETPK